MYTIAGIVAPIFAIILLGAAARHYKFLDLPGLRGLNDLTFYLALPMLLFGAVVEAPRLDLLDTAFVYFAVCLFVYALGVGIALAVLRTGLAQASVIGLNCCYGNTVMLGVPVVSAAFGSDGVAVLLPVIALHSIVLLPLGTLLIEAEGQGTRNPFRILRVTLPSLLKNPIIVALLLGMAWHALAIPVPSPLHRFLAMWGAGAPALALFALGASLPDFAKQGSVRETGLAVVMKLLLMPALVWGLAKLVGTPSLPAAVAVLTAGTPTGANAFFLARRTGTLTAASAGTVVVATALSIVTLSVLLSVVGRL